MSTLKDKYLESITENYEQALGLVHLKVQDYASDADPFKNFRNAAYFAGVSLEQGILVRIGDKFARYLNLLEKGGNFEGAVGEKLDDTLRDAMNYANILLTWEQLRHPAAGTTYETQAELPLEPVAAEDLPTKETTVADMLKWLTGRANK